MVARRCFCDDSVSHTQSGMIVSVVAAFAQPSLKARFVQIVNRSARGSYDNLNAMGSMVSFGTTLKAGPTGFSYSTVHASAGVSQTTAGSVQWSSLYAARSSGSDLYGVCALHIDLKQQSEQTLTIIDGSTRTSKRRVLEIEFEFPSRRSAEKAERLVAAIADASP